VNPGLGARVNGKVDMQELRLDLALGMESMPAQVLQHQHLGVLLKQTQG